MGPGCSNQVPVLDVLPAWGSGVSGSSSGSRISGRGFSIGPKGPCTQIVYTLALK